MPVVGPSFKFAGSQGENSPPPGLTQPPSIAPLWPLVKISAEISKFRSVVPVAPGLVAVHSVGGVVVAVL